VRGTQDRVDFGSHVSGSVDGIIERGVPGAPKARHLLECKTSSKKAFDSLIKDGVQKSKPLHYIQMQAYMRGLVLDRALYYVVCKDDDRIYTERVRYDKEIAERYITRAQSIALTDNMPPPISEDPAWYECKFCPAYKFCHQAEPIKSANCRTCAHSTSLSDSTWHCAKWDAIIPTEAQLAGCENHVIHPDMVPWERKASGNQWQAIFIVNGKEVVNGAPGPGVYSSKELLANPAACAAKDSYIESLRADFDARVVA
jgi:hypothetical protein